uniref:site-specific integrase n=1 Tax=Dialister sp. TaxID=1955814 RepID=UPI0040260188
MTRERETKGNGRVEDYTTKKGKLYRSRITINGKRYTKAGFTTKRDANAWIDKLKKSKIEGTLSDPNGITFSAYAKHFIDHQHGLEHKRKTIEGYESILSYRLLPYFKNKRIRSITTTDVNIFLDSLAKEGLAVKTKRNIRNVLNGIMVLAVQENVIGFNPLTKIPVFRETKKENRRALTGEEVHQLLHALDAYYEKKKNYKSVNMLIYPYVYLAIYTGARRGELCALTWDDIDVEKCTVSINKSINEHLDIEVPKTTNAYRVNVIPKDVMAKLLPFKDSKCNKVFHTCTGEYIKPSNIARAFRNILKFGSLPHIRLHELRHTLATLALQAGVPITDISKQLGHASISTTLDFYSHASNESSENVVKGFSEIVDNIE